MKLAVCTSIYKGCDLHEALDGIEKAGFKNIEIAAMNGWCEHIDADMSDSKLGDIKELIASKGLSCVAISAHENMLADKGKQRLLRNIAMAEKMEVKYLITVPGEGDYDDRIDILKEADELLKKNGIKLLLEPHAEFATVEKIMKVIDDAATSNVAINFDTANGCFFAGVEPVREYKLASSYISYMHIKDKIGGKEEWNFPPVGQGDLPIKAIIEEALEGGYDGFFSVEIEFTPDVVRSFDNAQNAVEQSFKYISIL